MIHWFNEILMKISDIVKPKKLEERWKHLTKCKHWTNLCIKPRAEHKLKTYANCRAERQIKKVNKHTDIATLLIFLTSSCFASLLFNLALCHHLPLYLLVHSFPFKHHLPFHQHQVHYLQTD